MRYLWVYSLLFFIGIVFSSDVFAQQQMTLAEYQNAIEYTYGNLMNKKVFNLKTDVHEFEDYSGIWFVEYYTIGKTYQTVAYKNLQKKPLFDHIQLAEALAKNTNTKVEATALNLENIEKTQSGIRFKYGNKSFSWDSNSSVLRSEEKQNKKSLKREAIKESTSPDGRWIAYVKAHNLYLREAATQNEFALTTDGKEGYDYASSIGWFDIIEGEGTDRPEHFDVQWSSDSKYLVTQVVDTRNAEKMYLLDYSIDSLYKPKLLSYYRGSPGDTTMVMYKPVFFDVPAKKQLAIDLPAKIHVNGIWLKWQDGEPHKMIASYRSRGYKNQYLQQVDLDAQTVTPFYEEAVATSIDNFEYREIEGWNNLVLLSERSGWKQLYLLNKQSEKLKPLTSGDFVVNEIASVNAKKKEIYYLASGVDAKENPYHQKLYKVSLAGKITLLTPETGNHDIQFFKDSEYFIDAISTVTTPTQTVLRAKKDGKIVKTLTTADIESVTKEGWQTPDIFTLAGKDGKTPIYGALWKPVDFDATLKYPVIDATYTGPHTQRFPRSFNAAFSNQAMANLGFIVVVVDGLGTAGRSKAFRDVSYQNMGDNLRDHVNAIQFLNDQYNWVDVDRVGIFGHSAGGYDAAHALLAFPDFYKVAVASSGDHDFRMEKAWWPEMYMGYPVDERYEQVSNVTMAPNLKGKLLLVHGGIDDNVNPSGTYKLAEALIKADKDFDLLIIPSQRHGYTGKYNTYFQKKRWNYFIKNLLNKEPLWEYNIN
ncbi:S9 family peptidase [Leeuwenhoekiella sp. MAR_2009_132]|uniref:S9 family peptidase n=1 Tax=Leeuwenhoekiella sp. MAR_2009_132 TaxID=1392489 RepID=UPI00048E7896|nr:prolyl oligopeptidase family serine peptidase [Leeuwenhoekiella sp. MAR_2009_132]